MIAGLVAPGASQIVYTWSVRTAGASRTGILIGAAPVVAALLAIVLLDEPFKIALAVGTVAIVMGTAALVGERDREVGLRLVGTLFGLLTAVFFGLSAVALRWAATESEISPLVAATVTLGAGAAVNIVAALPFYLRRARLSTSPVNYLEPLLRSARAFLAAGALLGLAYLTLLEAFERGRVTVVSPLTATEIIASASCRVASATDSRTAARWSWLSLITRILTDRIVRPPPSTTA